MVVTSDMTKYNFNNITYTTFPLLILLVGKLKRKYLNSKIKLSKSIKTIKVIFI